LYTNEPVVFKDENERLNWDAADVIRMPDVLHQLHTYGADRMEAAKLKTGRIPELLPDTEPSNANLAAKNVSSWPVWTDRL
jgi:hypothetical protein